MCSTNFGEVFEHLFKDCSDFGFYPSFIDFSDPQAAVEDFNHNLFVLKQGIIDQLMAMRGVESFRPVIDKASILLDTVPGTTLRDLELYLIYEGKVSSNAGCCSSILIVQ